MSPAVDLGPLAERRQSRGEEIANTISHGLGLLGASIAMPILLLTAFDHRNSGFFAGTIVFACTMLALYLGSTLYHAWPYTRTKHVLRVFDHCAIFLLIAGTYTHRSHSGRCAATVSSTDAQLCVGDCPLRSDPENDRWTVAREEAGLDPLSRDGLAGAAIRQAGSPGRSVIRRTLAACGWNCLYRRCCIFR